MFTKPTTSSQFYRYVTNVVPSVQTIKTGIQTATVVAVKEVAKGLFYGGIALAAQRCLMESTKGFDVDVEILNSTNLTSAAAAATVVVAQNATGLASTAWGWLTGATATHTGAAVGGHYAIRVLAGTGIGPKLATWGITALTMLHLKKP